MKTRANEMTKPTPKSTRGLTPWDEMDRSFDTLFNRGWLRPFYEMFPDWMMRERDFDLRMPKVEMLDNEEEILVRAELPGVDKKDLDVNISGQMLTIKGETKREEKEEEKAYFRSEITRGSFSRTLQLPVEVDEKSVKAVFNNGLLEVHLPKTHKVEKQKITVE
ncbi:MAG: Hsp20/alpha crystallin family protein [Gammaproteobacteria bacterium]|nr:Hsp20/alpha crystallin family protein [Gammaproteobacteria bacterium]MCB1861363.1 Hsp20/alpha crystallin family protein [Gammaproteobacteria bacterium]MCB1873683.1 Hsp20/alpha crystallin family protein [Gammaproteobacteria bacterium]MCB1879711.1 Hsp20/alpha crystallin family protein [Gammaproteobacteria bacterium]MCB1904700.1 Hsp20/alpha crystallin family protein [Gammaproteobacteria bacterium]